MNTAHLNQVVSQSVAAVAAQLVSVSATWSMYTTPHLTPAGEEMPPRGPPIYRNTLSRQYLLGKLLKKN